MVFESYVAAIKFLKIQGLGKLRRSSCSKKWECILPSGTDPLINGRYSRGRSLRKRSIRESLHDRSWAL